MTQRDRLIELLDTNCGYVDEVRADELADHLIENNVMVLPCKVGDTVYILSDNEIFECFLKDILTYKALDYKLEISRNFNGEINGKQTVFLTKEAAENALKGLNIE